MSNHPILLIDDEEKLRSLLARLLSLEGFVILEAKNAREAWKILEKEPVQLVLCDVKLPDANGVELSLAIKQKYPCVEIILLTAYGRIADGVTAMKNGAFDYLVKGDDNERIIPLVHRAMEKVALQQRVSNLESKLDRKFNFDAIIGKAPNIQNAIALARKVSNTSATVLLTGETGTGKEVFAQAIHQNSSRSAKPFVAINCSAFGRDILESELFGHKAGAFTGAVKDKKGLFEEANQGTLFLDEIGEMGIELQAKLLRVLESGTFIKVGDTKTQQVDVRIIAATNRNLLAESEAGRFRADLFYRLSVFQIQLPPLRDRIQDIAILTEHFVQYFAAKLKRNLPQLQPNFLEKLQFYPWKGNIRELKNTIERAMILVENDELTENLLPIEIQLSAGNISSGDAQFDLNSVEKQHIAKVMAYTKGNKVEAARLLNIGLTTLYRKIEEYQL
jgi:two-component system, NtrC family, response regulator